MCTRTFHQQCTWVLWNCILGPGVKRERGKVILPVVNMYTDNHQDSAEAWELFWWAFLCDSDNRKLSVSRRKSCSRVPLGTGTGLWAASPLTVVSPTHLWWTTQPSPAQREPTFWNAALSPVCHQPSFKVLSGQAGVIRKLSSGSLSLGGGVLWRSFLYSSDLPTWLCWSTLFWQARGNIFLVSATWKDAPNSRSHWWKKLRLSCFYFSLCSLESSQLTVFWEY